MKRGLVVAAALLLVGGSALAQGGQGGGRRGMGGRMGGGFRLLGVAKVQEELKMTQPQIAKVEGKQQEVQQAARDVMQQAGGFQAIQGMTPEERQKLFTKIQDVNDKAVAEILDTTQIKRFKQLELQQAGVQAFNRPAVAERLQLTTDQKDKIAAVGRDAMQAGRDAMQGVDPQNMTDDDRAKMAATNDKITADAMAKVLAVLTDAQKAQWKEMTGAAFKFPPMGFGGRRGPGA